MERRTTKVSGKKGKGNNASGRSLTVDFVDKGKPTSKKPLKKPVRVGVNGNPEDKPLTAKQEKFCRYFVETNNGEQSAIRAGYGKVCAGAQASENLRKPNIVKRIKELRDKAAKPSIATSTEVMQFFTDVMNGKVKDQFGLEASLSDRTKAAVELAKRTVDLDQKMAGKPDATIEIKLDWKR